MIQCYPFIRLVSYSVLFRIFWYTTKLKIQVNLQLKFQSISNLKNVASMQDKNIQTLAVFENIASGCNPHVSYFIRHTQVQKEILFLLRFFFKFPAVWHCKTQQYFCWAHQINSSTESDCFNALNMIFFSNSRIKFYSNYWIY